MARLNDSEDWHAHAWLLERMYPHEFADAKTQLAYEELQRQREENQENILEALENVSVLADSAEYELPEGE